MPPEFQLRRLTLDDVPQAAALTKMIGWSQDSEVWKRLIGWGGDGAICITHAEKLVGTTVVTTYNSQLAWVGVVITHPDYRGQGLAKRLMAAAMDDLYERGVGCIMLDASLLGYPLYQKLGFRDLYRVETWQRDPTALSDARLSPTVRPIEAADLPEVIALDGDHFGFERPQVIEKLWQDGHGLVDCASGSIDGYLLLSKTGQRIGPWYHRHADGAENMLTAVLARYGHEVVRIQPPADHPIAIPLLKQYGFTPVRHTTRMVYGGDPPGQMERQYAIASLATG